MDVGVMIASEENQASGVTGGVDTHLDQHVCVAVCSVTMRRLGASSFPVTGDGYRGLLAWLESHGVVDHVGIEGTGTYGAGLSRFLIEAGVAVLEVNRPDRSARRSRGKSDDLDAETAARAVLSGQATAIPKSHDGAIEAIRVLRMVYTSAVKDRTAAINQFHAVVSTAPESIRQELAALGMPARVELASRWRERRSEDVVTATTRRALRELAARIGMLDEQADRVEAELTSLVESAASALVDRPGVGVHTAAELLMAVGDNRTRIKNEAAFAHLCGAAPVPASSGKTNRHRLNFAGNRAANHALWRIVMARMAQQDPRTIAYVERRTAEGLSKRDIMRCLKRYVAREAFRVITDPPDPAPTGASIRSLRLEKGLTQTELAAASQLSLMQVSRIERGVLRRGDLQHRCHRALCPSGAS
jgi:transposase